MKPINIILIVILVYIFNLSATAQCHVNEKYDSKKEVKNIVAAKLPANTQSATINVSGNCESCKARIEKAARKAEAINADWSAQSQTLTIAFNPKTSSVVKISKAIAFAGHDTDKYKADDKTYAALPGCCKYERTK